MRFGLASFAAVAAATLAVAQPSARDFQSINPPSEQAHSVDWASLPAPAPAEPVTNAKRFAANLPPLAPKPRHRHRSAPHRLGTRVQAAPRAETSPLPPLSKKCNLLAKHSDGTDFGFISPSWNPFGEHHAFQPTQDGALEVTFSYTPDPADTPDMLNLRVTNPNSPAYQFFGGITGFASTGNNFAKESPSYAYLGGTIETLAGSPAVPSPGEPSAENPINNSFTQAVGIPEAVESAIWSYDPATQAITPQWINEDGSSPATSVAYVQGVIVLTGDTNAVANAFGPTEVLTLSCVPSAGVAGVRR